MKFFLKYILFIGTFGILGYYRDFLFVNLNYRLFRLYYNNTNYVLPESLMFFNQFDYNTLYYIKYPITVLFFIAYFATTFFAVRIFCLNKKNTILVIYIYILLLVLAGMTMIYNYIINHQIDGDEYSFARWLMGIGQSPLVSFFIIASSKLYNKFQNAQP